MIQLDPEVAENRLEDLAIGRKPSHCRPACSDAPKLQTHAARRPPDKAAIEGTLIARDLTKSLQHAPRRQRRLAGRAARRGRRPARAERRRQDDLLLHDHRPRAGRRGHDRDRRQRRHQHADVPARAARRRLSAAGSLDLSRADGRGEHPRRAGGARARTATSARTSSTSCSRNSTSRICASRRRSRCPAASGGVWKSPARWPPSRPSCCSTSPLPASTRSRSPTSRTSCAT